LLDPLAQPLRRALQRIALRYLQPARSLENLHTPRSLQTFASPLPGANYRDASMLSAALPIVNLAGGQATARALQRHLALSSATKVGYSRCTVVKHRWARAALCRQCLEGRSGSCPQPCNTLDYCASACQVCRDAEHVEPAEDAGFKTLRSL